VSVVPDDRTLGQVLHEARIEYNPKTERPRGVPPWPERAPWQQQLDEEMAAGLAAVVTDRIAAMLDRLALLQVPGLARDSYREAAAAVRKGQP
jgi:hypothetical protein